jgi:hypothetical protein
MIRLRGLLDLLAARGGGEIRACELDLALASDGPEVRSALRAQGIVRDAAPSTTVPCDGLGCAREVRELRGGTRATGGSEGRKHRLFGVCTRTPAECETIELDARDVAQEILSREAFVAAVEHALRVSPAPGAAISGSTRDARDVTVLGEETADGETRDVLLAWRPDSPVLRAMTAERANRGKSVRVLTPPALAEILTVRDGRIAELPRLHVVPPAIAVDSAASIVVAPPAPSPPAPARRSPALDGLREITRWNEVTVFDVDEDDLVGVTFDERLRRVSCVDFGLATVDGRRPIDVFLLLKTICRGNGNFETRAFGSRENGKRLVSQLRTAMRRTFGLADDPFVRYSYRDRCWKPKFRALAAAPKVVAAAEREFLSRR